MISKKEDLWSSSEGEHIERRLSSDKRLESLDMV